MNQTNSHGENATPMHESAMIPPRPQPLSSPGRGERSEPLRDFHVKPDRSAHLAGAIFDEILVPLARERRAAGAQAYFPYWRDEKAQSYFSRPELTTMRLADFELHGAGSPAELVESLAAYWTAKGDTALAAMAPRLKELAEALGEQAAENDGKVDILCYTLF